MILSALPVAKKPYEKQTDQTYKTILKPNQYSRLIRKEH